MELVRYETAKNAIAEYKSVDEVKDFRDKAIAIQAYAKQANDYGLERDASIARVRAERKCGELLRDMEKAKGGWNARKKSCGSDERLQDEPKTLTEMGLTKDQSSKWQKLADIPEEVFERVIDSGMPVSGAQVVETAEKEDKTDKKIDTTALWIWGRLRDMEKNNIFSRPLSELVSEMTDGMRPDIERIIPKLKRWLNE